MRDSERRRLSNTLKNDYNLSYYALKLLIIVVFALIPSFNKVHYDAIII
ncbi:MAG TPA: hypothetical protein PKC21_01075 [Oligoflexia bacterium]|mgnify:CR=1 FL=1|nr:hypothetical protein [Oligoflexia bacterium]